MRVDYATYATLQRRQRAQSRACATIADHFLRWRIGSRIAAVVERWHQLAAQAAATRAVLAVGRANTGGALVDPDGDIGRGQAQCDALAARLLDETRALQRRTLIAGLAAAGQLSARGMSSGTLPARPARRPPAAVPGLPQAAGDASVRPRGLLAPAPAAGATWAGSMQGAVPRGCAPAPAAAQVPAASDPRVPDSEARSAQIVAHMARRRDLGTLDADAARQLVKQLLRTRYPHLWHGNRPGAPARGETRTVKGLEVWRRFMALIPADGLDDALRAMGRHAITLHHRTFMRGPRDVVGPPSAGA